MFSEKCSVQNRSGIQRVKRIGNFVVIVNKWRYEQGVPRKFALVHEADQYVHSVHGSERSAVAYAQKRLLQGRPKLLAYDSAERSFSPWLEQQTLVPRPTLSYSAKFWMN